MHFLGVELWCCRCNRYIIIDTIIVAVVVMVCVPVFITVSAARVYTGILLGVAVIILGRLWRFLPSHKRWVERQACKMAVKLVAENRTVRPPTQLPWLPPADPSANGSGAVVVPFYYPCAAPSSSPFCRYYRSTPVPSYDVTSNPSTFTNDGHMLYGGSAVSPPTPPPPLAMPLAFSSPRFPSLSGPLGYSPYSLLLLSSSPQLLHQVRDHSALHRNEPSAPSHWTP
nr:unnamed protein product [Leishmania braziliensis]